MCAAPRKEWEKKRYRGVSVNFLPEGKKPLLSTLSIDFKKSGSKMSSKGNETTQKELRMLSHFPQGGGTIKLRGNWGSSRDLKVALSATGLRGERLREGVRLLESGASPRTGKKKRRGEMCLHSEIAGRILPAKRYEATGRQKDGLKAIV